ncbi:hypothetical protein GCM10010390_78620 [Streptomyces mordarskii]|uniref:Uncharacterized protein n=1 Tax=Streptomyces mordarskii TaxID=1226758 RepID=A0ABN1EF70_9ACTN
MRGVPDDLSHTAVRAEVGEMDIAGQMLLHGVTHLRTPIARHVGEVGQTRGGRGGGAEPLIQLMHQVSLEQRDEQGVTAEQGGRCPVSQASS